MNMLQYSLGCSTFLETRWKSFETGLLNTLIGMLTVFAVLVLISLIISCFSLIGKAQRPTKNTEVAVTKEAPMPVVTEEIVETEDDTELVAVITAAIMASMGDEAPADGLVVRSIRRVGTTRKAFHA